jgi:hypothetical protein
LAAERATLNDMARGWESKAVEAQQEAAEAKLAAAAAAAIRRTPEEIRIEQQRESLLLSKARVLHDLETATKPRYREMLENSLRYLDEKIASLEPH